MTSNGSKSGIDLGTLLDTYGADTARWPERERARMDEIMAAEPWADRLLAEARALDTLLARAPLPSTERRFALASRIVAIAEGAHALPAESAASANVRSGVVIPWPRASRSHPVRVSRAARLPVWRAAALLAASLIVGVFVGAFDLAPSPVNNFVEAVSLDETEQAVVSISNDGLSAALDEDFL
ncbi:MAG: hypothetical protein ACM31O_08250 [Bacteroidota bacterium]